MCTIDNKVISVGKRGGNASKNFHVQVYEMVFGMIARLSLSRGGMTKLIKCYVNSLDAYMVQSC